MADNEVALLPGDQESGEILCCGCVNCKKWMIWRAEGSNRRLWKLFCTLSMLILFFFYLRTVRGKWPLITIALLGEAKFIVEIWGQDTPTWVCPGGPVMYIVAYFLIFPFLIFFNGLCTVNQDLVFHGSQPLGIALFVFGSGLSLWYELSRFQWKKQTDSTGQLVNKGKLHTIGLAAYCVHPNYFGDLFAYSGWALCAGTSCAMSVPVAMVWSFMILVDPNSDAYLASKYPEEWPAYSAKTASLIPFLRSPMLEKVIGWAAFALSCYLGGGCSEQCG